MQTHPSSNALDFFRRRPAITLIASPEHVHVPEHVASLDDSSDADRQAPEGSPDLQHAAQVGEVNGRGDAGDPPVLGDVTDDPVDRQFCRRDLAQVKFEALEDVLLVPAERLLLSDLFRVPLDQFADGQVPSRATRRRNTGAAGINVGLDPTSPEFGQDFLGKRLGLNRVALASHLCAPRVTHRDNACHTRPFAVATTGLTVANP